jgi:hypothetical protein
MHYNVSGCIESRPRFALSLIVPYGFVCSIHRKPKRPFGYVGVLQEEDVSPSDGQRDVLNQLRDWDLWCVESI